VDERTEQDGGPRHSVGGWAVPGAGEEHPGLSWEGEGEVSRTRPPAGSRSLVWRAAAVVAAGALLGGIGLALARGTSGSTDVTPVPGREQADPTDAQPGDCLASLPGAGSTDLDVVPCERQHLGEVVGVVELEDDTGPAGYPGDEDVAAQAAEACTEVFTTYVGIAPGTSDLGLVALPPTEAAWRTSQDRAAVCIAEGPDRVGSVRGSGG
jgi:hypothetical protein